jgi:hypothetical protein
VITATTLQADTAAKIARFMELPRGWHYGRGVPSSRDTALNALRIVFGASLMGFTETDAFAGADGEIQVTIYHGDVYLEFTVDPDEGIRFVREDGEAETARTPNLSLAEALTILKDSWTDVCHSSGLSTAATTTREREDFLTSLSRIPKTVQASLSLSRIAQYEPV